MIYKEVKRLPFLFKGENMSLNELLAALAENSMLYIEIIDGKNTLIEFEAPGYGSLNDDLLLRTVEIGRAHV